MKLSNSLYIITSILFLFLALNSYSQRSWEAPEGMDTIRNPIKEATADAGKKLFNAQCSVCHGPKGKGDGIAGASLKPTPADLGSEEVQSQKDGVLFWKISEGRAPMPSYRHLLSEDQRWKLVNYIRTLGR